MKKQCEAILIVSMGEGNPQSGEQCHDTATGERAGHHVCWLHKGAVRGVQFAGSLKRLRGAS